MRAGPQISFQLHRLPVQPERGQGQTHPRSVARPPQATAKNQELLAGLICLVRQLMSLIGLLTATEKQVHLSRLHMKPILWHLKSSRRVLESLEKVIPIPRPYHPHLKWWLEESNALQDQPLHPLKYALQIFTDTSKEGWGARLNECTARGTLRNQKLSYT